MDSKAPIGVLAAISTGFDRVAARPLLILPPLILDLILWLGPRLSVSSLLGATTELIREAQTAFDEDAQALPDLLDAASEGFNLLSGMSSMPTGIPSLMAGRMPIESPVGVPTRLELEEPAAILLLWALISAIGIAVGTIYHRGIAQAVSPNIELGSSLAAMGRMIVFGAVLFFGGLLAGTGLLFVAGVSFVVLPLLAFALFSLGFILLFWLAVYVIFTPQGIVRYDLGVIRSMLDSFAVVRWNLLGTVGFLLLTVGSYWILNLVWVLPADDSWFAVLAVAGHSFISATILTASYVFYQGRREWTFNTILKESWVGEKEDKE